LNECERVAATSDSSKASKEQHKPKPDSRSSRRQAEVVPADKADEYHGNAGSRRQPYTADIREKEQPYDSGHDDVDGVPSAGSLLHAKGECKPCLYLKTKTGCFNGNSCHFCHYAHTRKRMPRPCKAKRVQCKQIVNMLDDVADPDILNSVESLQQSACQSPYMRKILQGRRKELEKATHLPERSQHQLPLVDEGLAMIQGRDKMLSHAVCGELANVGASTSGQAPRVFRF
jgi:hypothetical protein